MRQKAVVLAVVFLVGLSLVTPVAAAGRGRNQVRHHAGSGGYGTLPGNPVFALVGTITEKGADSITVQVVKGNRWVQPYLGQPLDVQVTDETRFRQWTPDGCIPIPFDEVEVGDATSVSGLVEDADFVAGRITVDVPFPCCLP